MKLLIIVAVVCLCSGANANGFTDALKNTVDTLTTSLKAAVEEIKAPTMALVSSTVEQVKSKGAEMLMQLVSKFIGSLSTLGHPQTRDISLMTSVNSVLNKGKAVISKLTDTITALYHGAMSSLQEIMDKITSLKFLDEPLQNTLDKIDEVLHLHGILQSGLLSDLIKNPTKMITDVAHDLLSHFGHKRSAPLDALKSAGHSLGDLFSKLTGGLSQGLKTFGEIAKNMAAQIAGKLQVHVNTIKDGVNEIVGHGKNAMAAMQAAFKDIAAQTISNMTPSLTKIIGSTKDAINTAINTMGGAQ